MMKGFRLVMVMVDHLGDYVEYSLTIKVQIVVSLFDPIAQFFFFLTFCSYLKICLECALYCCRVQQKQKKKKRVKI